MDAEKWKDTILAKSREYVEIGVSVASDLTEKGKTQAKILSNQAKINKAQRQLGALVYSLAKNGEENRPLVEKYIAAIGALDDKIHELKNQSAAEGKAPIDVPETPTKTCPQCGCEVEEDALFCSGCGAQL